MGSVEAVAEELHDGTTRVVALKRLLRATGAGAARVEMFLREARLTTLLEHPNVIRSFEYGESGGDVFLAMEYIAGEPLSRLLAVAVERGDRLPLPVIAYVLAEACEGLHAAHELRGEGGDPLGVVHRDVSPHNVMVGFDGAVKLLDFGVAKVDLIDCVARTKTGEVKGKTAYMSPEQAMGEPLDRRSDLYSMGAVLFECVAGRRMWGDGTDLDVLRRLALEDPPRLGDAVPDVPAGLAALHARLIERDPERRPSTAHELAVDLRAYAVLAGSGEPVDASVLRSTMARLFEGERERREAAIASALTEARPGEAAAGGAGESGPVFVTHQGLPSQGRARRPGVTTVAAVVVLAGVAGALVLLERGTRGHEAAPLATPESAQHAAAAADPPMPGAPAVPAVASARPEPPPASAAPGSAAPGSAAPPSAAPRSVVAPHRPAAPVLSASATAVVPSAKPATPEPPYVDPTPF
jgi:serine/threonine-protein kinase